MKVLILGIVLFPILSFSHQPVMDMAPRWNNGYGIQTRYESYGSSKLIEGKNKIENPFNLKRSVKRYWLEGVYTFKRHIRVTAKLPYVEQERTKLVSGVVKEQLNSGMGDLILALPLKKYRNESRSTSNLGVTPQVRLPTGESSGEFPISDGSYDLGLSVSYSAEGYHFKKYKNVKIYQMYDVFYWANTESHNEMHEGDEIGIDINFGLQPYHNTEKELGIFTLIDISYRNFKNPNAYALTTSSGGERLQIGPVIIFFKGNYMLRMEYKSLVQEKIKGISNSRGNELLVSFGFTGVRSYE